MALPGVLAIETAGLKAWPSLEVEHDGGWVRRAANGYTKRANSVQSLDPGDDHNARERILAADAWFRARGLRPVFRVTPLAGPAIVSALDELGWVSLEPSQLLAMELGADHETDPRAVFLAPTDAAFLAAQQSLQGYDERTLAGLRGLLGALAVPATGIVLYDSDGVPVASGLMAIADGIVVTGNVVTDPSRRRQGHGMAMMKSGLAWAYRMGARVAALNVVADNEAAQTLYAGLGYAYQYDYSYRLPVMA